jgi:hypothetical protein
MLDFDNYGIRCLLLAASLLIMYLFITLITRFCPCLTCCIDGCHGGCQKNKDSVRKEEEKP